MASSKKLITLDEARLLREQLRPAFAGYVTDGNVSNRDVLGTIMNLISRGYVGINLDTQSHPNKINYMYLVTSSGLLLPFEKAFLRTLFSKSRALTPEKVKKKIDSGVLHKVIEENALALSESKIARQLLIVLDKEGKRQDIRYLTESGTLMKVRTVGDLVEIKHLDEDIAMNISSGLAVLFGIAMVLFLVIFGGYVLLVSSATHSSIIGVVGYPLAITLLLFAIFIVIGMRFSSTLAELPGLFFRLASYLQNKKALKNTENLLLLQFRDNVVPYMKGRYEELFDFIKAMPLKQQRIYNEFMPHAVAFGLDTSWNESFGIETEPIVSSQVYGRALPQVEKQVAEGEVRWFKR